MISSPDSHGIGTRTAIRRCIQFSSLIDRYQDDGFGNATPVKACTDKSALDFILEDLH